ncbi:MAG: M20/M25/M40 family metallo-hydrolase [Anaerolineae bacterium]|nr:M20/M25/M40 family metallo-hydrolase [Anaerolineae bacterium]
MFVLLACNLGTESASSPPTLVIQATATPPATLGFNAVSQQDDSSNSTIQIDDVNTSTSNIGAELYALMQQVDAERLMAHVQTLQDFQTRHVNSTTTSSTRGIGAARNYVQEQFEIVRQQAPFGNFTVQPQAFDLTYAGVPTQQFNIIGYLQGIEPGAGVLVIGAHYDSIGPDFNDAEIFAPGANDNGTGVAALLEMARIMSQRQYRSSVIFVAFSAEEVGRVGSRAFVDWARGRNIDIVGMINIDTIGNNNTRSGTIDESLRIFSCESESICRDRGASRHMARAVEFLGFAHNSILEMQVERTADREGRYGDHFSFSEGGYPAIRFINTLEEWGNGSSSDTIQYVERDYFRKSTQSILLVAIAYADGPSPPSSITLRDGGDNTATLRWEPVVGATGYIVALRFPGSTRYDQQLDWPDTSLTWDGFANYAGVAIGAKGPTGLIGRLSQEYVIQPG